MQSWNSFRCSISVSVRGAIYDHGCQQWRRGQAEEARSSGGFDIHISLNGVAKDGLFHDSCASWGGWWKPQHSKGQTLSPSYPADNLSPFFCVFSICTTLRGFKNTLTNPHNAWVTRHDTYDHTGETDFQKIRNLSEILKQLDRLETEMASNLNSLKSLPKKYVSNTSVNFTLQMVWPQAFVQQILCQSLQGGWDWWPCSQWVLRLSELKALEVFLQLFKTT